MTELIKNFENYSRYYDIIYKNKKYKEEVNHIFKLLEKIKFNKRNLLEFGSGTGKHAEFLIKKGFKVHGIEKSKKMISMCKKLEGFTFQQGDICKIKLKKKYDIILSLFHVISYQTNNQKLENFFKNSRYHLNSNGLLGFDFWYSPAVKFIKPKTKLIEIKKKNFKLIRLAEPILYNKKKIVNVKYTLIIDDFLRKKINIIEERHLMRHFNFSDLYKMFKKYKFKCLHTCELITNKKPGKNTWGIFCLLQKY